MAMTRREWLMRAGAAGVGAGLGMGLWGGERGLVAARAGLVTAGEGRRGRQPASTGRVPALEWKEVRRGLWVALGDGGNTLVGVGADESFLVDTKNAGTGWQLRREAEAKGRAVQWLINTHHHADHTGGNAAFMGMPRVAHEAARERVKAQLQRYIDGAKGVLKEADEGRRENAAAIKQEIVAWLDGGPKAEEFEPLTTIRGNATMAMGGYEVELKHFGAGHTDNDVVVVLAKEGVVHTGDLVFNKVWPYVDRAGGFTSAGWLESLKKIVEVAGAGAVVVPGHGAVGDVEIVKAQMRMFERLRDAAAEAVKQGEEKAAFQKREWKEYADYAAADWIKPITLGGLWEEAAEKKK